MIKNKIKTKEGRTNSPMFKHLKPHEFITFDNKREQILVYVDHVKDYSTFESMLKDGGLKAYLPNTDTIANGVSLYKAIPRYTENEKKYGVVGIEFTVVDKYIDVTTTIQSILNKKANNNTTNDDKVKSTILSSNIKRKRNDDDDDDNNDVNIIKKIK
jgi:ASC-1-like (ASCH) protein